MDRPPTPPITLYENGDLEVYPDVASACDDLEVYGVRDGSITAFDSLGNPLRIDTDGYDVTGMLIAEGVESGPRELELELELRTFIARVGPDRVGLPDFESASLDTLLEGLLRFFQSGPTYEPGLSSWLSGLWRLLRGR